MINSIYVVKKKCIHAKCHIENTLKHITLMLQLASIQKENQRLRGEFERELTARQTLQLQMEGKEQMIASLRGTTTQNWARDPSPHRGMLIDTSNKVTTDIDFYMGAYLSPHFIF